MTQPTSSLPKPPHVSQPIPARDVHHSKIGIVSLLVCIGMLLLLFAGLVIRNLPQAVHQSVAQKARTHQPTVQAQDSTPSLLIPGKQPVTPLQIPSGHYLIYEQQDGISLVSAKGGPPQLISTPGYIYNRAVAPIITPSGQLLYSGDGLWLTDIIGGIPQQIAHLLPDQVITSMALSSDGSTIAWSTEPIDGKGNIEIYAGPLETSTQVYQQSANNCPCFRVFSFFNGPGQQGKTKLLLTDDRGDHHAVQYGLWTFDLSQTSAQHPQLLLDEDSQQGPLALVPHANALLYSNNEGIVPKPTDGSTPSDLDALSYANSLYMTTLTSNPLGLKAPQVILPEQRQLSNSAEYHWITTPLFSPDGHTLVYVVFSSDAQAPFDRHSALYTVQISSSGTQLRLGKPQLLATSAALLVELGVWFDNHILTFYADGTVYAVDVHTGSITTIVQTGTYARIIAAVGQGIVP